VCVYSHTWAFIKNMQTHVDMFSIRANKMDHLLSSNVGWKVKKWWPWLPKQKNRRTGKLSEELTHDFSSTFHLSLKNNVARGCVFIFKMFRQRCVRASYRACAWHRDRCKVACNDLYGARALPAWKRLFLSLRARSGVACLAKTTTIWDRGRTLANGTDPRLKFQL